MAIGTQPTVDSPLNRAKLADTDAEWMKIGGGRRSIFDTNSRENSTALASNLTADSYKTLDWSDDDDVDVEVQIDITTGRTRIVIVLAGSWDGDE